MRRLVVAILLFAAACKGPEQPRVKQQNHADPNRGKQLIEQLSCSACHVIPGIEGPRGRLGPSLEHIASRPVIAGKLQNTPDNVAKWIQNPQAFDPGNTMPALGINEADARDITAFLFTLK